MGGAIWPAAASPRLCSWPGFVPRRPGGPPVHRLDASAPARGVPDANLSGMTRTPSARPSSPAPPDPPPDPAAARRRTLGAYGEAYAARHLVAGGMVLLDRNWRCDAGEIDLVLREGPVLVVCEVKTRTSTAFGSPVEGVDERKASRLRRLAARWLAAHDVHPADVRIDVVGVLVPRAGQIRLDHVRGVG